MSGWTDERVEILKRMWLDGLSASQVARSLGGFTRNAVIGKVHRLGLSGRGAPTSPPLFAHNNLPATSSSPPRQPLARTAPPRAARPVGAPDGGELETGVVASLEALGSCMCKWPLGDPRSNGFSFCGRPTQGGSYCQGHAAASTRPSAAYAAKSDRGWLA